MLDEQTAKDAFGVASFPSWQHPIAIKSTFMTLLTEVATGSTRIRAFRDWIIKSVPRVPSNRETLAVLEAAPVRELVLYFLTWRSRLIPTRPRMVSFWSGGALQQSLEVERAEILPLLRKAASGEDLTPHLSTLVNTRGLVLPSANPTEKGKDLDGVLIRNGLHHFHVGAERPSGAVGRTDKLVFAHVLKYEFRVIAISDHTAFALGTAEHERFFAICQTYISKDLQSGEGFMMNPVMSSGHDMYFTLFGRQCEELIASIDPMLDDPATIDRLYAAVPSVPRPQKTSLAWYFEDLKFGLLEKKTRVFFCFYPLFDR